MTDATGPRPTLHTLLLLEGLDLTDDEEDALLPAWERHRRSVDLLRSVALDESS